MKVFPEFRIRRRNDGEVRWLEARGQIHFDSEKHPKRLLAIHADVTERMRAKEEMHALEEQFRHAQKMELSDASLVVSRMILTIY